MSNDFTAVARQALAYVPNDSRIGLGSGRTTEAFIQALGERVRQGLRVRGVPTSSGTAKLAEQVGIPLDSLDADEPLAVTIDGADEVERGTLNLIKGWGGALVRERIVAAAATRQIILVTHEKMVERLGTRGKLPVEVIPFAVPYCRRRIEALAVGGGLRPSVRLHNGQPFVTDNGHWILDCALQPQTDPAGLERDLLNIAGVVDTGLFLGTADLVLLDEGGTIQELQRITASRER